jgi:putative spermidine/putrescine transport system substrate-binding protein
MNKRLFVVIGGMVGFLSINVAVADQLTLGLWGGSYAKSQEEAMIKPYAKTSGNKMVIDDYSGGLAELRAQVESGSSKWDVLDMMADEALRACDEGLLEKIDAKSLPAGEDGTPASQDFLPNSVTNCAVGTITWSTVVAYNAKNYTGEKPSTIADFFDVKRFPGKRGLFKKPQNNLEWALIADGVPANKVYEVLSTEEGLARAFKKLDSIKSQVVWMSTGAQPTQLLATGEVSFSTAYNARVQDVIDHEAQPFRIIWDHQFLDINMFTIPRGSKNKAVAEDFIKFATATRQLGNQTNWIAYGPARKSAIKFIKPENESKLPTYAANAKTAMTLNHEWWADHADELSERFNVWMNN